MNSPLRSRKSIASCALVAIALLSAACTSAKPDPEPQRPSYTAPTPMPSVNTASTEPKADPIADVTATKPEASNPAVGIGGSSAGALMSAAPPTDLVIATVDGQPVYASDLMQHWMLRESRQLLEYFTAMLEERLVQIEAKRMGVTLDPAEVDNAVIDMRVQIEAKMEESQPGMGFDQYIQRFYNMSADNYLAGIRRTQVRRLLLERVVRAWLLTQEHAELRVIIVTTEELGDQVVAALKAGESFEAVATQFSEDPTRERGGVMAPVIRSEQLLLSRLAFGNPVDGITGPVEDNGRLLWVQTTGFPKPLTASWGVIESAILEDLNARPLDEYEFLQWKSFIELAHEVDASTFIKLIGEGPKDS